MGFLSNAVFGVLLVLLIAAPTLRAFDVLLNASPSAPRGIYIPADLKAGGYVSFCVPTEGRVQEVVFSPRLCTDTNPGGTTVLKKVVRISDVGLTVQGRTENSLDSRVLGTIPFALVRGSYALLIAID